MGPQDQRFLQQATYVNNGIVWIDGGEEGANRYPVSPGYSVPLFDKNEKRFFIKSVDVSGMPMPLREFKYDEVIRQKETPNQIPQENYITKDEFDNFQNGVLTKMEEMMQKYISNQEKKNFNKKGGEQ